MVNAHGPDYCRKKQYHRRCPADAAALIDWVISAESPATPYRSAKYFITVLSKATATQEDREALITTIREPYVCPNAEANNQGISPEEWRNDSNTARVNHKRVKQLRSMKNAAGSQTAILHVPRILAGHFEDMAMAQNAPAV